MFEIRALPWVLINVSIRILCRLFFFNLIFNVEYTGINHPRKGGRFKRGTI
ncbi:hypothetical protein JCM17380_19090 [Desulfosporosinus burensis]